MCYCGLQRMCRAPAAPDRRPKAGLHTGSSKEEARAVIVIAMSGLHLQVQGWPEAPFIETNAVLSNGLVLKHCSRCGKNGCSGAIPGARVKSVSCRQRTCILALANPLMPMSRSGGTPSMGCETVVCWAVSRLGALLPPAVVCCLLCATDCVRVPCGCRRGVDFWVASTHRLGSVVQAGSSDTQPLRVCLADPTSRRRRAHAGGRVQCLLSCPCLAWRLRQARGELQSSA